MDQMTLILLSVFMGAAGQILLKVGANILGEFDFSLNTFFHSIWVILKSPVIVIGLILFGLSFMLWVKVLTKSELSQAYPMVSLSYVIIGVLSPILFNEQLTANKVIGMVTIVAGVFILNK